MTYKLSDNEKNGTASISTLRIWGELLVVFLRINRNVNNKQ